MEAVAPHAWESPSKDEGSGQPCAFTALKQSYPALLNSVVSSSTREIIRIKYSSNSSTFPHWWKSGTLQWSAVAKLPSARSKFRMGQFWNGWLLHLRLRVFMWTVRTDEISIKWWNSIIATIMRKSLPGLPGTILHFSTESLLRSNCNSYLEKVLWTISFIRNLI